MVNVTAKSEAEWQAESDANTLAEAGVIRSDSKRLGRAKKAAKRIAKEQTVRAKTLAQVAKGRGNGVKAAPQPKRSTKKRR